MSLTPAAGGNTANLKRFNFNVDSSLDMSSSQYFDPSASVRVSDSQPSGPSE